jgi:phosphotransferase system IIB component
MIQNTWTDLDLEKISEYLKNVQGNVVLGIDGFIDNVWQVIETRTSKKEYVLIDKMKKFGEIIVSRGEGGMANELVKKRRSCGGFTANTGRALGKLELSPVMVGMYGKVEVEPIFSEFIEGGTFVTVGDPVVSNILEFTDGKIMMPYLKELLDFDWNQLVDRLGHEKLKSIFGKADIVSLGYLSNMPEFDEIISNIYDNYLTENCAKRMFFDFANVKKMSEAVIKEKLKVLGIFNDKLPMTLSLNEHEAALLFSYYGEELAEDLETTGRAAAAIRKKINLDEIIVHTPHYALAASKSEGIALALQDYRTNPVITTGAGDTFNGGYIAACLHNLNMKERLAMANATTSFYLNNSFPPNREELLQEVKRLKEELKDRVI